MKKLMIILALGAALLAPDRGSASPADTIPMDMLTMKIGETTARVNGTTVSMEAGPILMNGRTLVSYRFLGEALGAAVSWNQKTQTATLKMAGLTILMPLKGNPQVNGSRVPLDVPAIILNGRLYVPLRFIGEQLGCYVQYDGTAQVILLRRADKSAWKTHWAPNNLSYKMPWSYSPEPAPENQNILLVKAPNGAALKTYFVSKKPELLLAFYQRRFIDEGWVLKKTYLDPTMDPRLGYEIRYAKVLPDGTRSTLSIFVDPLASGSNVGEIICPEAFTLTEGFLLYQVMGS